ncbi:MAG: MaoC family dehydratase N-terminal domain-containing protein [Dehalococcoidia bacterium]|nr:MaoC family dehydratase N-terminal domain-containing protein [Dehalococcoidia bacterium]
MAQDVTTKSESLRHGKITDEGIRAVRARMNWPSRGGRPAFYDEITKDNIRHFAMGVGDINLLFNSEEYANKTLWAGMIAPPCMLYSTGSPEPPKRKITPEELVAGKGGGLPGVHGMFSGTTFDWYLPMRRGDRVTSAPNGGEVFEKEGRFAGRELLVHQDTIYRNQNGEVVATARESHIRTERQAASGKGKYSYLEPATYTDEDLEKIWADYDREEVRGANPRYWEDVVVGEEITPIVKGPLTVTDMVAWKIAWGFRPFVFAHRLGYDNWRRRPGSKSKNQLGVPDVPERVHWDNEYAREVGVPAAYDYGPQRISWLGQLMTNWIGDDGFLRRLSAELRRFNLVGDTTWCRGRVVNKEIRDGDYLVECEIWCVDQRGEITAPGRAIALLPSRVGGSVALPAKGRPEWPE